MKLDPCAKFSFENPYCPAIWHAQAAKDMAFAVRNLPLFAEMTAKYLLAIRRAKVWEVTNKMGKPLIWDRKI